MEHETTEPTLSTLYRRWLTELWNGDMARLESVAEELVDSDFVGHWPGRPGLVHGPWELAAVVRQGRLPFSRLTFAIEVGPLAHGAFVSARWKAHGTYAGGEYALPGADAAPGTAVSFHGHDIIRTTAERIVEYWVISESEYLMEQLTGR